MEIRESIHNLRNLKDEALRLRDGMDYEKAIQIADFCDYAVQVLGEDGAFYGNWQEVASMKTLLHLSDVETVEQQEAILSGFTSAYKSRFDDADDEYDFHMLNEEAYHRRHEQVAALNSADISDARERMADFFGAEWPSYLFTPTEIHEMANYLSFEDDDLIWDIRNKINAMEQKFYTQYSRIEGMRKGLSVDELRQDFIEKRVFEDTGSLYNKDFDKWIFDEYKSIYNALPEELHQEGLKEDDISTFLSSSDSEPIDAEIAFFLRRYAESVSDDFLSYQKRLQEMRAMEQDDEHGSVMEASILTKLSKFIREGNPKLLARTILEGMASIGCTIEDVQKRMADLQKSVKDIMFKDSDMYKRLKENENKSKGKESSYGQ